MKMMLVGEAEAMDPEAGIKISNFIWNRIMVLPHCPPHRETHSLLGFGAPPSCAALCAPARGGGWGYPGIHTNLLEAKGRIE